MNINIENNVTVNVLNNHSGIEVFEKIIVLSEPCAGTAGEAYLLVDENLWVSCEATYDSFYGFAAYIEPDCLGLTNEQISLKMLASLSR